MLFCGLFSVVAFIMCVTAFSFFVKIEDLVLASFVNVKQITIKFVWNFSRYFSSNNDWFRQSWQDLLCKNERNIHTVFEQRLIWRKKISWFFRDMFDHRLLSFCQTKTNDSKKKLYLLFLFFCHEIFRLVRLKSLFKLQDQEMKYFDHEIEVLRF